MRLIDADALSDKLCETTIFIKDGSAFQRMINDAPTVSAEAVEVIRCKDCYHAEDDITHMFCVYFHHKVYEDDYCSNAVERREDGEA